MYRRRRLAALGILILVIALVWWLVATIIGALGAKPDSAAPDAAATEATAAATDAATPPPASDSAPEPAASTAPAATPAAPETPAEPPQCTAAEVTVTAKLDAGAYGPDQQPQLSFSLTNHSDHPCHMDVGTAAQEFAISSGSDLIWLSTHCMRDATNQVVQMDAGRTVDSPPFAWVRERSTPDTCDGERPAAVAGGSYYNLTVTVGGIASEPVTFVLE